jgi:hypothetical protein
MQAKYYYLMLLLFLFSGCHALKRMPAQKDSIRKAKLVSY